MCDHERGHIPRCGHIPDHVFVCACLWTLAHKVGWVLKGPNKTGVKGIQKNDNHARDYMGGTFLGYQRKTTQWLGMGRKDT